MQHKLAMRPAFLPNIYFVTKEEYYFNITILICSPVQDGECISTKLFEILPVFVTQVNLHFRGNGKSMNSV